MSNLVVQESILFDPEKVGALYKSCAAIAKTPFLKPALRGKPEAVFAIVLMAKELNIPPMQALSSMHFIQGIPTLPTATMLALARRDLRDIVIEWKLDEKNKVATCVGQRDKDSKPYTSMWDMAKAKQMGLLGRDQYIKQPLNMLKWRATAEVLRVIAPDAISGIYGAEEFQKFDGTQVEVLSENEQLIEDFNIPKEELETGPKYRIANGKHRNKQLEEFTKNELETYKNELEKQISSKAAKPWHDTLHSVICSYLQDYDETLDVELSERVIDFGSYNKGKKFHEINRNELLEYYDFIESLPEKTPEQSSFLTDCAAYLESEGAE